MTTTHGTLWSGSFAPGRRRTDFYLVQAVSAYIRAMPILWVEVDDAGSKDSHRKVIEHGTIALLSNAGRTVIDPPSPTWLGQWAQHPAIRESSLWNVQHVTDPLEPGFLDRLAEYVLSTTLHGVSSR